jgi:hypothetical protein
MFNIILAILQNRGVIVQPLNQEIPISAAMKRFSLTLPNDYPVQGSSDLISHLRGYLYWEETTQRDKSFELSKEMSWCQKRFISLYWIREIQDLVISIRESLGYQRICSPPTKEERDKIRRNHYIADDPEINEEFGDSTEDDSKIIDQAIRILDNAAYETPSVMEISQEKPTANVYKNRSYYRARLSTATHESTTHVRADPNLWTNVFDRTYEISDRPVNLNREPNVTLLTILLTAAFHQNLFHVIENKDNRVFKECPKDYNRNHTIEFSAQILPPKKFMIEALGKDIGVIQKMVHPENSGTNPEAQEEYCYVEFVKPGKSIWTHSRDRNKPSLPDAVFLAQKFRTVKNGTWTEGLGNITGSNSEDMKKLRFSGVSGCPETSTGLKPIFRLKSSRVYSSKTSLFFPLIIDSGERQRYSVCAGKLLAVDYGNSYVAEHITCLIGPSGTRNNIGDAILAFFANKVENNSATGWHVHDVNYTQYPLFYSRPSDVELELIQAVRCFLRLSLFETNPIDINDHTPLSDLEISACKEAVEMINVWNQRKMTASQAGKLLTKSVLMIL